MRTIGIGKRGRSLSRRFLDFFLIKLQILSQEGFVAFLFSPLLMVQPRRFEVIVCILLVWLWISTRPLLLSSPIIGQVR